MGKQIVNFIFYLLCNIIITLRGQVKCYSKQCYLEMPIMQPWKTSIIFTGYVRVRFVFHFLHSLIHAV